MQLTEIMQTIVLIAIYALSLLLAWRGGFKLGQMDMLKDQTDRIMREMVAERDKLRSFIAVMEKDKDGKPKPKRKRKSA